MNRMLSQRNETKCWTKNKKGKRVQAQCIRENNSSREKKHKRNCFQSKNGGWEHNNCVEANLKERWIRIE
jgi:hypothetical protein